MSVRTHPAYYSKYSYFRTLVHVYIVFKFLMSNINMGMKLCIGVIALIVLPACQQESDFEWQLNGAEPTLRVSIATQSRALPTNWSDLKTYDEKVRALQIDEAILEEYSTADLVRVCVEYPLAHNCFFYNDISQGFEMIAGNFNGFKVLETREDALSALIDYYEDFLSTVEHLGATSPNEINPFEYAFIELMLASGKFGDFTQNIRMIALLNQSDALISRFDALRGHLCDVAHTKLSNVMYGEMKSRSYEFETPITVYTKNGLSVFAYKRYCYNNSAETAAGINLIGIVYPNAVIVGEASCEYNCHAYAWYMSQGGERCWINHSEDVYTSDNADVSNVSKFWRDGTYLECSQDSAERVFYNYVVSEDKGDHSAIVVNKNLYESKWGSCQIVRHAPDDCPYGSSRSYFKTRDQDPGFSGTVVYGEVNGDVYYPFPIGTTKYFSIKNPWSDKYFRTEMFVSGPKEEDEPLGDTSSYTIVSSDRSSATVTFNSVGIYYVCFKVYHRATGQLQASYKTIDIYVEP